MAVSQRLVLRQAQSLVMTPQLQQAIKLLQLSHAELTAFIDLELEGNPLLERDEAPPEAAPAEPPQPEPGPEVETSLAAEVREQWEESAGSEGEGDIDRGGDPAAWASTSRTRRAADEDFPGLDQTLTRARTLRDHLMDQISVDIAAPADRLIAHHLLDLLDEAGYVQGTLTDVAERLGAGLAEVERVLDQLQRMDPAGVFARNLAEGLALQLRERDRLDPAMQALLDHLPLLASRNLAELMRICGVDAEDIRDMAAELRSLDPKPGLAFDPAVADPVIPDVLMRGDGEGGWIVELNAEALPRVLVNNAYYAQVSQGARKPEREYLSERFQAANWLVKALHQRATTILKVSREIVRQQDGFFRHGIQRLRPLVLRDIAGAIDMHESTVSRVTSNKFMATPRGMFELKYFFTSSIAATNGAAMISAETVRSRIKALIEGERSDGVLSDDQIVDILVRDGVDIARRTVAKYREAMRIPSSVQRRREKTLRI